METYVPFTLATVVTYGVRSGGGSEPVSVRYGCARIDDFKMASGPFEA